MPTKPHKASAPKKKPARKKQQRIPHVMFDANDVAEQNKAIAQTVEATKPPDLYVTYDPPLDLDWHKDVAASFDPDSINKAMSGAAVAPAVFRRELRAVPPKPKKDGWFAFILKVLGIK